jgi:outer membrane protein insertion porin family
MHLAWLSTLAAVAHVIRPPLPAAAAMALPAGGVESSAPAIEPAGGPGDTLSGRRLRPEVTAVVIKGAHAISADDIRRSIVTSPSHCRGVALAPFCLVSKAPYFYQRFYLDRDELKRDLLRIRVLYWLSGYRLASVDTAVSPPGGTVARITLIVHEGPPTRVTSVTVAPDTVFLARVVHRLVTLRPGAALNIYQLDSSVRRLRQHLYARGYGNAVVDTAVHITGQPRDDSASRAAAAAGTLAGGVAAVDITMIPRARTTVDTVIVTGNQHVSSQTIRHAIALRPGGLFIRSDIQRSQRALYQTNLFRSAVVTVDSTPQNSSPVAPPPPNPGGLDTTEIPSGGARPSNAASPPGTVTDTVAGVARHSTDSAKAIHVNVAEGPSREVNAGVGFTTADFVSLSSHFTNYNWVGGGRQLLLSGGLGNLFAHGLYSSFNNGYKEIPPDISPNPFLSPTWSLSADVTQPWFLGPQNALSLGLFAHRRIAPGVFIDNGNGGHLGFTHDLGDHVHLNFAYRYEVTHVDAGDVYFCVDYGVCDASTRDVLRNESRLSPFLVGLQIDRSNDPLNPTAGYIVHAEFQHASQFTASDFRYNRAYAVASLYRPVGRAVIAFNARAGVVGALGSTGAAIGDTSSNVLHPTVRFYAGGAQSVRGFGENQLGPRVLTIAPNTLRGALNQCPPPTAIQNCPVNVPYLADAAFTPQPLGGRTLLEGSVEYRFPLVGQFGGALFVDGAIVGEGNLPSATSGTHAITPGFGVRYYSIVGPIRVDLGLNPLTTYHLVVLTENANRQIVQVTGPTGTTAAAAERVYTPAHTLGGLQGLLNRFSLHLSIGQAF